MAQDKYQEVFAVEIEGWVHGITQFPGEISYSLVFSVIREIAPAVERAIQSHVVINIPEIASKMSQAAKYLVDEQRIALDILAHVPHPKTLDAEGKMVLIQVVDRVEKSFSGAQAFIEQRWGMAAGSLKSIK